MAANNQAGREGISLSSSEETYDMMQQGIPLDDMCCKKLTAVSLLDSLELVAKVDLGCQDLEQNHDLLIWKLAVFCHKC